jgi:ABC-2 type transport system permease protein
VSLGIIWRLACHEFGMQVRRPATWLFEVGTSLLLVTGLQNPWNYGPTTPLAILMGNWSLDISLLGLLGYGLALADRAARERAPLLELLGSQPVPSDVRTFAKYVGNTAASLVPVLGEYLAGVAYVAARFPYPLPEVAIRGAEGFAVVIAPAALFVAAVSLACPLFIPVTLYQVLFVGYWIWASMLNPRLLPTTSDTVLNPLGVWAARAFFGVSFPWVPRATPGDAWLNVGLILLVGATFIGVLVVGMRRRLREAV